MPAFSMTCACGDVMSVDAETREQAVEKIKGMMTVEAVAAHMAEKHAGEPVPAIEAVHQMVEEKTVAV